MLDGERLRSSCWLWPIETKQFAAPWDVVDLSMGWGFKKQRLQSNCCFKIEKDTPGRTMCHTVPTQNWTERTCRDVWVVYPLFAVLGVHMTVIAVYCRDTCMNQASRAKHQALSFSSPQEQGLFCSLLDHVRIWQIYQSHLQCKSWQCCWCVQSPLFSPTWIQSKVTPLQHHGAMIVQTHTHIYILHIYIFICVCPLKVKSRTLLCQYGPAGWATFLWNDFMKDSSITTVLFWQLAKGIAGCRSPLQTGSGFKNSR